MRRRPTRKFDLSGRAGAPPPENATARFRQLADQPVRLDRIFKPRFGPSILDAGADRFCMDFLTVAIKQRQFAASLVQATLEVACLRWGHAIAGHKSMLTDHKLSRHIAPINDIFT